ncbi:proton-conducting transporter membrane subunit [Spirillospora sp. NPDC029432]|uniref:proton-conducting transporter transmembrane domain-containing protein n=1 Tax=Spirillospora sp. NPDC029432 TaxID=3154599 RepID=UPI003453A7B5
MSAPGWALPGLPLAAGALLLLAGRRADRLAPALGVAAALATLAAAIGAAAARPAVRFPLFEGMPGGLAVDGLSAALAVTAAAATLAVLVFAAGDMPATAARARFCGLMLVFAGAMLVTVTATDLAVLLMGWEVMGAMSYALIGFRWRDPRRTGSAGVAFLTTRAGDLGLYAAAGCAVAGTHALSLDGLAAAPAPWRDLIAAGIVAAALGKSAQLPFSFWLSRAMDGPSPVSALLHSATMVAAGAYLLLRLQPLLAATGWAGPLVAWAGALTALLLGAVALAQRDLKQLLAASTCAQVGFMVLAAGAASIAGGAAHLVAHAAVKSLLFLCAGAWLTALGTRDLARLRGAARRHRLVGAAFTAGALALAGLPPLSLWATKGAILTAVAEESRPLYAVGLAAAVLATLYALRALLAVWRPAPDAADGPDAGFLEKLPLPVLAAGAALLGVLALPGLDGPWRRLLGTPPGGGAVPAELLVSGSLAVTAVAAALLLQRHRRSGEAGAGGVFARWLHLERLAVRGVARPVVRLAAGLAWFDDRVVDGAVRAAAAGGRRAGGIAARRGEPAVDGLVEAAGRAGRRLGRLARRPQTGLVHTYYAQAAVAFFLLVLVAVLVG